MRVMPEAFAPDPNNLGEGMPATDGPRGAEPTGKKLETHGDKPANVLDVLLQFCDEGQNGSLDLRPLAPDAVAQPYRDLLVHSRDMTPTLERFYGERLGLEVIRRRRVGPLYLREVLLVLPDGAAVEYGAIRINLTWFPSEAREEILAERLPLGRILQDQAIAHLGWPQGFYRIKSNKYVEGVLGIAPAGALYGRRNVLLNGARRLLADVIEILTPVEAVLGTTARPAGHEPSQEEDCGTRPAGRAAGEQSR